MKNLRSVLGSPSWLQTISWKIWIASIAVATLDPMAAHAELPVTVPAATAALLAWQRDANIHC